MPKITDKLTKKQVLSIPRLLKTKSIGDVACELGVTWQSIWYWIKKLRDKGVKVKTRKRGQAGLLD